jgi:hypothetical protein
MNSGDVAILSCSGKNQKTSPPYSLYALLKPRVSRTHEKWIPGEIKKLQNRQPAGSFRFDAGDAA